jgi:dihydroorotate dehydrogenase electron transfer subunit
MFSMFKNHRARIIQKQNWGNDYFLLSLESPEIAKEAKPGQFLMVKITDKPYPLLRRPFSIHARNDQNIEIFFQNVGEGTSMLSQKQQGDPLEIMGPLGNGFHIESKFEKKRVSLIGGGRGIAPLYFLAHELLQKKAIPNVFYGGKSSKDLPIASRFKAENIMTLCSTEDGTSGFKGFVTDLFEKELEENIPSFIFACGPENMLKKISEISKKYKIPAELSLESIMGCGFGVCWGCVKKIRIGKTIGWHKICEDGPVFLAENIIWD